MATKRSRETSERESRPNKRLKLNDWLSDADSESDEESGVISRAQSPSSSQTGEKRSPSPQIQPLPKLAEIDEPESSRLDLVSSREREIEDNSSTVVVPQRARNFAELGVSKSLVMSLGAMLIKQPTEVQVACIPPLLAGRDCIGNAKTGSGKTVAFAIPILEKLRRDPYGIFALILTPTRELAFQIADQFSVLGNPLSVRTAVIVGGMDMVGQAIELEQRPHVVVATPGRLVDHMKSTSGGWNLNRVKFLVLDEADRLLTPTFASELQHIFQTLPTDRQTSLFTATITDSIEAIAAAPPKNGKEKPFVHRMKAVVETVETLKQYYLLVPSHIREAYLFHLLCNPPESIVHMRRAYAAADKKSKPGTSKKKSGNKPKASKSDDSEQIQQPPPTIIFCNRPKTVAYLTYFLQALEIRATSLHSRMTQRERLNSLDLFRGSVVPVLISTDVGARGLDIEEVALVINWDLPSEPEEYTHRVGRTARKGRGGLAVSFVTERDEEKVLQVETRIRTKLSEMDLPESKVLEPINKVFTAQRVARLELQESEFGKREEIHQLKSAKSARQTKMALEPIS